MPWYLEEIIFMVFWINDKKKHIVVPIVMHDMNDFSFLKKKWLFSKIAKVQVHFDYSLHGNYQQNLWPSILLEVSIHQKKTWRQYALLNPFFLHCSSDKPWPHLHCMANSGLCWSDILPILKLAWFCNNWNHSWMTIAIDLSFLPLIQKTIWIISSKYHGITVNTLEVIGKYLGGTCFCWGV